LPESKSIEEKIEEMEKELEKDNRKDKSSDSSDKTLLGKISDFLKSILEKIKKSKGFLTSKGKIWSKSEGHAVGIGISTLGLAYILPTPMGELFILMLLGFVRTGTKKWARNEKLEGHLGDVVHEWAYTIVFAFITALYFETQTGYSLSSIDIGQLVLAMVGGA